MLPLEGGEEVKEGKGLKVFQTIYLPDFQYYMQEKKLKIIHKLKKTKSAKYYIFCINKIKSPKHFA